MVPADYNLFMTTPLPNRAQIDSWNGAVGATWIALQERLDAQVAPLGEEALRALGPRPGERILDVGCGCGQTTLALAARVAPAGAAVGIDVSAIMLDVARARPAPAGVPAPTYRLADAQTADLGMPPFDAAYSRFGVMFFADPIAAFANLRRALRPGGRLAFVCWRSLLENAWMRLPLESAACWLEPPAPADPAAPGPFAFAARDHLRDVLAAAGFAAVSIAPYDAMIGAGGVEESLELALRVGPLGAALRQHPELRDAVAAGVRSVLADHATPCGVRMQAGVWIVRATR